MIPNLQRALERSLEERGETPVTKEIARYDEHMPAMSVEKAIQRKRDLIEFVAKVMIEGHDFGLVPGTQRPSLLKPGAERLASYFGLSPAYQVTDSVKDWTGKDHGGEPLFAYDVKCILTRHGEFIGDADGHCNSWEKKYRYRQAGRTCPKCGAAAIRKSNWGGWYCWDKLGGCSAKFKDDDAAEIEKQTAERQPNPDIADAVNTILKMAEKRALIAAILNATNASEFFTQDEHFEAQPDDDVPTETVEEVKERLLKQGPKASRAKEPPPNPVQKFDYDLMVKEIVGRKTRLIQLRGEKEGKDAYYAVLGTHGREHANEIKSREEGQQIWRELTEIIERWEQKPTPPLEGHEIEWHGWELAPESDDKPKRRTRKKAGQSTQYPD